MSLGVSPSVAINGVGFFNLPTGMVNWEANGIPVNPSGFSVVVGKPVNLTAYASGTLLQIADQSNQNFSNYLLVTPTSYISFLQTYVNVTQIQLNNLNTNYEVQVTATNSKNVTQAQALLAPGQLAYNLYIPSGTYSWNYVELNKTTGNAKPLVHVKPEVYSGQQWITINGVTLFDVSNQLTFTNASIQKSIQQVSIYLNLSDSNIKNLTLGVDLNLSATNTSIQNVLTDVLINETFLKGRIGNISFNESTRFDIINSTLNKVNFNETSYFKIINSTIHNLNFTTKQYFQIVHSIVTNISINATQRYTLEKTAGAFAYHFVPKNETLLSNGVDVTSWLENVAGKPVNNKSLVFSVWSNLTMEYINMTDQYAIKPTLISYGNYSVTFFLPLNQSQINAIQSSGGKAEISMFSPFRIDTVPTTAVGYISPSNSNLQSVSAIWSGLGFTTNPPYSPNVAREISLIFTWIVANAGGRLLTFIVGIATLLYFLWMYTNSKKRKSNIYGSKKLQMQVEDIHKKVVGN